MKKEFKIILLLLCAVLLFSVTMGCSNGNKTQKIGIFMPTRNETRWAQDSDSLMRQLQAKGYQVEIKNAEGDVEGQIRQIDEMINGGCDILVITAIDGSKLTDILQKAADKKIKVIAYDRLIMDTPNVDYYVTFDNFEIGRMEAAFIEEALGLKNNAGPYNIELFAGALTDNNAKFFYDGAMSILKPYIDSGKLIVRSGLTDITEIATLEWLGSNAKIRMDALLKEYYQDTELHAVLSPNDGIAIGIIEALREFGFGSDENTFPILTGQDSDIENIRAILNGEQSMTIFKDTRTLADRTFRMIDDLLLDKLPETNDSKTYNNNIKIVPTYMCKPVLVTRENYKSVLIDSGYYELSDLQ